MGDDWSDELGLLVPRLRRLEPDAFDRLYLLTVRLLASVAYGMLRDRDEADDAVQEAFLRFVGSVADFRGEDGPAVRAYLVRIAKNVCIDRIRSRARRTETPTDDVPDRPSEHGADTQVLDQIVDPELEEALARLTPDQRLALTLRYVEGLSGGEIAAALDRNPAAVYTLLRRAEGALRRELTAVRSGISGTSTS
ncbi:MAG: RNA polymerase sigma factor [Nitriliruptorales bacterium]